eukprot:m.54775 g.54775  ORF g.54775 m.54775 type:complete len:517 (-) comp12482_c0_seq3:29-1579(-)
MSWQQDADMRQRAGAYASSYSQPPPQQQPQPQAPGMGYGVGYGSSSGSPPGTFGAPMQQQQNPYQPFSAGPPAAAGGMPFGAAASGSSYGFGAQQPQAQSQQQPQSAPGRYGAPSGTPFSGLAGGSQDTSYTRRRRQSVCERIQGLLGAAYMGVILLVVALIVLFWNEGRAVQTARSLEEGSMICRDIPNVNYIDEQSDQQLVYAHGTLFTDKPIKDRVFEVQVHAAKLRRTVEMMQFAEKRTTRKVRDADNNLVDQTFFSYETRWSASIIDSSKFDDQSKLNPTHMEVPAETVVAPEVKLGAYRLSPSLVQQVSNWRPIRVQLTHAMRSKNLQIANGYVYFNNPNRPQIGDIRLKFEFAGLSKPVRELGPADTVSVVAQQRHDLLAPFQTHAGDEIEMLVTGYLSKEEMFENAQSQNTFLTWILRLVGWLLVWLGLTMMTEIIVAAVGWIPLVGSVVSIGRCMFAFLLSSTLSLLTISIGWISYRPFVGGTLLVLACLPMVWGFLSGRKQHVKQG